MSIRKRSSLIGKKLKEALGLTSIPSNFTFKWHPHRFNFSDIPNGSLTGDVKFPHYFRNCKIGAIVDIPHDGINPFNFFHGSS